MRVENKETLKRLGIPEMPIDRSAFEEADKAKRTLMKILMCIDIEGEPGPGELVEVHIPKTVVEEARKAIE